MLTDDRERLYGRIEARIDRMLEEGLVEEVAALAAAGCTREMVSMQGLGDKEILDYSDGKATLEKEIYNLKRDTRHFAKRQLTWFRRERDVIWINKKEFGPALLHILRCRRCYALLSAVFFVGDSYTRLMRTLEE